MGKKKWVTEKKEICFARNPKCPRCGASDTVAVSTTGIIQYRKCRVPICRASFKQLAVKI